MCCLEQTANEVVLLFYVKDAEVTPAGVFAQVEQRVCQLSWMMPEGYFQLMLELSGDTTGAPIIAREGPKLVIKLTKATPGQQWPSLGWPLRSS